MLRGELNIRQLARVVSRATESEIDTRIIRVQVAMARTKWAVVVWRIKAIVPVFVWLRSFVPHSDRDVESEWLAPLSVAISVSVAISIPVTIAVAVAGRRGAIPVSVAVAVSVAVSVAIAIAVADHTARGLAGGTTGRAGRAGRSGAGGLIAAVGIGRGVGRGGAARCLDRFATSRGKPEDTDDADDAKPAGDTRGDGAEAEGVEAGEEAVVVRVHVELPIRPT